MKLYIGALIVWIFASLGMLIMLIMLARALIRRALKRWKLKHRYYPAPPSPEWSDYPMD